MEKSLWDKAGGSVLGESPLFTAGLQCDRKPTGGMTGSHQGGHACRQEVSAKTAEDQQQRDTIFILYFIYSVTKLHLHIWLGGQ